jgi:hypothetical protein
MPQRQTVPRAQRAKRRGKAESTQAGEFVREEMHKTRAQKRGARSPRQAIAIGLSKARQAGVKVPPPEKGQRSERTRRKAERTTREAPRGGRKRATTRASARGVGGKRGAGRKQGGRRTSRRKTST